MVELLRLNPHRTGADLLVLVERYKRNTHTRMCAYTPVMVELRGVEPLTF